MQRQVLHNSLGTMNPFKGPPGPEQVEAWESLLTSKSSLLLCIYRRPNSGIEDTNIRLTAEEVERMNVTSVQLADGSGDYLASLGQYKTCYDAHVSFLNLRLIASLQTYIMSFTAS